MLYLIKKVIHNNGLKFENIKSTQKKIKIPYNVITQR